MDELAQWCEIDGHVWNRFGIIHGLVLGTKSRYERKFCANCHKEEESIEFLNIEFRYLTHIPAPMEYWY